MKCRSVLGSPYGIYGPGFLKAFFFLSGYKSVHRNLSLYQEQQRNDITYLVTVAQDNIQL